MQTNDPQLNKLLTAYSLSNALREFYQDITVQVIAQQLGTATTDEQQLLNIDEDNSWIREVHILGDGIPRVHGRTVAPYSTYHQYKNALDNLGSNLLGEGFLYQMPHTRSNFEYAQQQDQWLRRSVFHLAEHKLLVTELFL